MSSPTTCYINGLLLRGGQLKEEPLWTVGGKICPPQPHADQVVDVGGKIIAPGYIDLQVNGAYGCDFTSNPEGADLAAAQLPRHGVTAFLPTVISSTAENYRRVLPLLQPRRKRKSAEILGIHLEGPFFPKTMARAHDPRLLHSLCTPKALEEVYGDLTGVKIVTLAPELEGAAKAIATLVARGIVAAAGHTGASYSTMNKAVDAGLGLATHLFNAMEPLHQREPGVVGAILAGRKIPYSLIADGVHLHPAIVKLAWQAHPAGLLLITDAIAAMGLGEGRYKLGERELLVAEGRAQIAEEGTLAGSLLTMERAVQALYQASGCSPAEAIEAATLRPARLLGIEGCKGTLNLGVDADFIFLDNNLNLTACYIGGEPAWVSDQP